MTGTTWTYVYDRGGNILHKTAYNYTMDALPEAYVRRWHYTYADNNWKDKLTAFDSVPITYDAIGNPLNDGTWTYTWEKGRQLKSMHNAATGVTMEFTYNHEGIRTQKVKKVNGEIVETTDYILAGKKIIGMQKGNDRLLFHYDEGGSLIMLRHNGTPYTYVKNVQGDIVGLIDSTGALVVEYKYDAWGNPTYTRTLTTAYDALAELNLFRYRGYVWDGGIDYYYLNSRYYHPHIHRFVSEDDFLLIDISILASSIYCYTHNNPIVFNDTTGTDAENILAIFYHSGDFEKQAKYAQRKLENEYGSVYMEPISNLSEFENAWKRYANMPITVIMIAHGAPDRIYFGGGESQNVTIACIEQLAQSESTNAQFDVLKIYACNCGHLDVENNIATVIANTHRINKVFAMDGNVSYGPLFIGQTGWFGYEPRLSKDQSGFEEYATKRQSVSVLPVEYRAPCGFYQVK